jgi:hypothetical protein
MGQIRLSKTNKYIDVVYKYLDYFRVSKISSVVMHIQRIYFDQNRK